MSKCVFSMRMSAAVLASCSSVIGHSTTDIAGMAAQALRLKWKALHFIFTGSEHSSANHHQNRHGERCESCPERVRFEVYDLGYLGRLAVAGPAGLRRPVTPAREGGLVSASASRKKKRCRALRRWIGFQHGSEASRPPQEAKELCSEHVHNQCTSNTRTDKKRRIHRREPCCPDH